MYLIHPSLFKRYKLKAQNFGLLSVKNYSQRLVKTTVP
ncbi:hypothetical protein EJK50_0643 [Moraxella catarrhalis]|nr:hypothetical protein EJK50_0643 [Moraxella catarrhalis]